MATPTQNPLAAQFRLSVMLADIEEADAKLEALRAQETEARAILVAALGRWPTAPRRRSSGSRPANGPTCGTTTRI